MLIEHAGKRPIIDPAAWVAPDATLCGDVAIGPGARVLYGARVIGEAGGRVEIGRESIVMENAVVRATARHPCTIGANCLIGPGAHVVGATLADEVFVATGAAIFHASVIGRGAEVRVGATVHLRTRLDAGATVPIGWVAVGDPPQLFSPDRHEDIWAVQRKLNFPLTVYGVARDASAPMLAITRGLSASLGAHRDDRFVDG
jgi:carbonic anhydrase/acetyltransferase-like protein (isoleucine patch superfamily)